METMTNKSIGGIKAYYSDGNFAISGEPYKRKQHTNQQNGLDIYVNLLNLRTGNWNTCKLYKNTKGYHAKLSGFSPVYLQSFTKLVEVVFYDYRMSDVDVDVHNLVDVAKGLDKG